MKAALLFLALISTSTFAKEMKGFTLSDVPQGSPYQKLGLKSKDKITKVNGKSVKSLSDFMKSMTELKSITIIRDGKPKTLNYNL